jgi:hypothetical protein
MTKPLKYITGLLFVFLLILAFWGGWRKNKNLNRKENEFV